jgi:hypothetical protein
LDAKNESDSGLASISAANPPDVKKNDNRMVWVGVGLLAVCGCLALVAAGGVGAFVVFNSKSLSSGQVPFVGQGAPIARDDSGVGITNDVPDMGKNHVQVGTQVNYNSNPPSSGPHYDQALRAGFYDNVVPDGNIVHSLEHGYVVIWYNCEGLSGADCQDLKDNIERVIIDHNTYKLIGMDRTGAMEHLIALTSWGKLAYLNEFDESFINDFIDANQNHSPEPGTP